MDESSNLTASSCRVELCPSTGRDGFTATGTARRACQRGRTALCFVQDVVTYPASVYEHRRDRRRVDLDKIDSTKEGEHQAECEYAMN